MSKIRIDAFKLGIASSLLIAFLAFSTILGADRLSTILIGVSSLMLAALTVYILVVIEHKGGELSNAIWYDSVTGLLNREAFNVSLSSFIDSNATLSSPFGVMVVDIDKFGSINKALGYASGDLLLQHAAHRIRGCLDADCLLARLGNDDFGIIVPHIDERRLDSVATRIQSVFSTPFELNSKMIEMSVSIGMSISPHHGVISADLIKNAEIAKDVAKAERVGFFTYDKARDDTSVVAVTLRADLRKAVAAEELSLMYQPKYDLKSQSICGIEALLRWEHPTMGTISPTDFIPIAEQTGLIQEITSWVLTKAIGDFSTLVDSNGSHLVETLSVNISPFSIANGDILVTVGNMLDRYQVDPNRLILEITESYIEKRPDTLLKILLCLNILNVGISIDDFGTGQSSLLYLKHLPVKEIKIDIGFVSTMLENASDYSIVKTTINLAHGLNCMVCAEGVETEATKEALIALGCDTIQGYLVARPMVLSDLNTFLLTTLSNNNNRQPTTTEDSNV